MIFLTDRVFYQDNFRGSQQEATSRIPPLLWLLLPIHHGNIPSCCADYKAIIARPLLLPYIPAKPDTGLSFCGGARQGEIRRKIRVNSRRSDAPEKLILDKEDVPPTSKERELVGKEGSLRKGSTTTSFEVGNNYSSFSRLELAFHRQNALPARNLQRARVKVWTFGSSKADSRGLFTGIGNTHADRFLFRDSI